ncbi:MAG: hypothetical protein KBT54_03415, partial [Amphritea sp.]|nr:hypothetical protein [Amphritea sp.]
YDLVTDYTSMLVVRDEVFKQLNIERNNQQRTDTENSARQQRNQQPVKSVRADNQKPMFTPSNNRASLGSGSGAVGHWILLLIGALLLIQYSNNRNRKQS